MTKLQFNEGDCLLDREGYRLEVQDGAWTWYGYKEGRYIGVSYEQQRILDALTEIVKPLRVITLDRTQFREDGMYLDGNEWKKICAKRFYRDLFGVIGWPIPDHMKEGA